MTAAQALAAAELLTDEVRAEFAGIHLGLVRLRPAPQWMMKIWGKGIQAVTLTRFIFIDPEVLNGHPRPLGLLVIHELTHVRQWRQGGIAEFSLPYIGEYLSGRRSGLGHRDAYMNISFEREARHMSARHRT